MLFGGSSEKQAMRGALSASALADPVDGALALLDRCDNTQLSLHYCTQSTTNPRAFLAQLAQKRGLVRKGGIPDCVAAARQILQGTYFWLIWLKIGEIWLNSSSRKIPAI